MKPGSTLILKGVVVLMGTAVLTFCSYILYTLNTSTIVGGYAPILYGMCISAIPFFIGLYQAWKLLTYIDKSNAFSELSVDALKIIKFCSGFISAMYAVGLPFIFNVADKDDAPGVILIALVIIFATAVVATFAALLQKLIKEALEIKSENDLTV